MSRQQLPQPSFDFLAVGSDVQAFHLRIELGGRGSQRRQFLPLNVHIDQIDTVELLQNRSQADAWDANRPPSAGVKQYFESAVLAIGLAFAECLAAFGQELAVPGIRREVIQAAAGPSNTELDFPRLVCHRGMEQGVPARLDAVVPEMLLHPTKDGGFRLDGDHATA